MGNMVKLGSLSLSDNLLTGSIPDTFINLVNLDTFVFIDNLLCEPNTSDFIVWKANVDWWWGTELICEYKFYLPIIKSRIHQLGEHNSPITP